MINRRRMAAATCLLIALSACGGGSHKSSGPSPSSSKSTAKKPPVSTISPTLFGMHSACIGIHLPSFCSGASDGWPAVPFGSYRVWDAHVTWPDIEPTKGTFNFKELDKRVAALSAHHVQILLVLGQSPQWATDSRASNYIGKGAPGNPRSLDDWRTYVDQVVKRYKGKITAYEVWNEPNLQMFYVGTPQQMAALSNVVKQEVHKYAPHALVVSPSIAARSPSAPPWVQQYLAAKPAFDVFGMHVYPKTGQTPEDSFGLITQFRNMLAKAGIRKPIWNTEITFGASPVQKYRVFFSGAQADGLVARALLGSLRLRVARMYWYAWDDHGFGGLYFQQPGTNNPTQAAGTWARLYKWLVGAHLDKCTTAKALYECSLSYANATAVAVWTSSGSASATITGAKCIARLDGTSGTASSGTITATTNPVFVVQNHAGVDGLTTRAPC